MSFNNFTLDQCVHVLALTKTLNNHGDLTLYQNSEQSAVAIVSVTNKSN